MGICVYWSCRHVVFVKRCNCSFYLTAGFQRLLNDDLRETSERLREYFRTDLAPLLAMVQELQPQASKASATSSHLNSNSLNHEATQSRLVLVQPKEFCSESHGFGASELRKGAEEPYGYPSEVSQSERVVDEDDEYKDNQMESSQANFQADGADGGSGAPRSAAKRLRKMDDLDKSRKWKTETSHKNRKSLGRHHLATGAAFLDKARSKEVGQRRWALSIVEHDYFNWVLVACLLANALTFGIQANVMANMTSDHTPEIFTVINIVFCVIFALELLLRIIAYRKRFLVGDGWSWNLFDSIVVLSSIIDEFSLALFFETGSGMQQRLLGFAGVLRMLRLGRVLRLVRLIRVIPALKSMVYLISASMNSFFWTGVLLLILMYCVAVYFTDLAADVVRLNNNQGYDSSEIKKYWGSLGQAVSSLFQAITGGMDWRVLVEVFEDSASELQDLLNIIFSLYIAFATLVMLNLVTGVLVEGAQRIAKEEKEQELIKSVQKLCKMTDISGDGEITWDEFEANLVAPEMEAYLKAFDMDSNQARDIFYVLDRNESGTVSLEEFVGASIKLHAPARMADREILKNYIKDSFAEMGLRLKKLEDMARRQWTSSTNV